jgi:pSer/pThr/pTyr-binding forkhead associated (FHA) protein
MRFVLQSSGQEINLPEGRFVIGRAETCQLALDDPLVSRNHAALVVTSDTVTLEDLGSRNGVKVNGDRVEGRRLLALGDVLSIGVREFKLGKRVDITGETLVQVPTQRMPPFGLMGMLADKALALGRGDEAERLLAPQLDQFLGDLTAGRGSSLPMVAPACHYALEIAATTGSARWLDFVFRVHTALKAPCTQEIVDRLYAIIRKVRQPSLTDYRVYIEALHQREADFGPAERFLLGRLEGLESVMLR